MRSLVILCLFGLLQSQAWAQAQTLDVIPEPAFVRMSGGNTPFADGTPIIVGGRDRGLRESAFYLSALAERTLGLTLPVQPRGVGIRFRRVTDRDLSEEGYHLSITNGGIVLEARTDAGLFYGAGTLWQLLEQCNRTSRVLPVVEIRDEPRFAWRGLMLDSARHYQSVDFIHRLIDVMALHKLNVLHWHLTDDQAWRLEIQRYPLLTSVGAWRVPAGREAQQDIDPATRRPRLYGGFYSQDEVRALVAYAASRHVTIVPEIEMPGHVSAALAAYPELGVEGVRLDRTPADWGVYPNVLNIEEGTFRFVENVLTEVLNLFPTSPIHVGGDEVSTTQWQQSARTEVRMRALNVAGVSGVQPYFMSRVEQFLRARGRRLVGWDEILADRLAPESLVMAWRGPEMVEAAAHAGHDVVVAVQPTLYFDNGQGVWPDAPPGRARIVTAADVYSLGLIPDSLSALERARVIGVQGNLWTSYIRTDDQAAAMLFPRAAAVAELGWAHAARDPSEFERRLAVQQGRYRLLGVASWTHTPRTTEPDRRVSQELESCTDRVLLNLEDDAPVGGPRAIFLVDVKNPCWIWRSADLSDVRAIRAAIGQVPLNFRMRTDAMHFRSPVTREGELEVRLGCDGPLIASLPLAPAANSQEITVLPAQAMSPRTGAHDLCVTFTSDHLDPISVVSWIELQRR